VASARRSGIHMMEVKTDGDANQKSDMAGSEIRAQRFHGLTWMRVMFHGSTKVSQRVGCFL
jgi:hypothetical protein